MMKQAPRRILINHQAMQNAAGNMMINGIIEEKAESSWTSPIVLVKKKDGPLRVCVYYQKLNTQTEKDKMVCPAISQRH